eukprot:NODE_221_length_12388_cov_2.350883.p11 type:complete len:123 gc:universal NODE_221_length_12388_cov_2.350883:4537-4169(-)
MVYICVNNTPQMIQDELDTVKQEITEALNKMQRLDEKLQGSEDASSSKYLLQLYENLSGIKLSMDKEEQVHIKVGRNELIMKEIDSQHIQFSPVEVTTEDLSQEVSIKKEDVSTFINFLKTQ